MSTPGHPLSIFVTAPGASSASGAPGAVDERVAKIQAAVPGVECRAFRQAAEMAPSIQDADVILGFVGKELLPRATRLRWVHSPAAGPDDLLYPDMVASEVVVTCSKGNGAVPLAEYAIMMMLMLSRSAVRAVHAHDEHRWDRFAHPELNGQTCGIIGLGYSGLDLALKAKAFHMRVLGVRRTDRPAPNVDALFPRARLRAFLSQSDFVVVTAPRTPETIGMLGEAEFRAMKRTAYYICFSRGGIADDAALLRALTEGWIAGAGLDAHSEEPLPPDSPFWTAPNTLVTPHNGATSFATPERGLEIFIDNLRRYLAGQPLRNVVDKRAGY